MVLLFGQAEQRARSDTVPDEHTYLFGGPKPRYARAMQPAVQTTLDKTAMTPSPRTRHAELLRLCARIGYSPPHAC